MAKDPAINWYFDNWDGGTKLMTRHQKGCYMDLLSAQFHCGHLTLENIKQILGSDFAQWEILKAKFEIDEEGKFFNGRTEHEILKRNSFSDRGKKGGNPNFKKGEANPYYKLVANGHRLILFTMRSGEHLCDASAWFTKNGIPLYGIQSNPTQITWTKSPKAYGQIYIDDAALGCPLVNLGNDIRAYVDWVKVRKLLIKQGVISKQHSQTIINTRRWK